MHLSKRVLSLYLSYCIAMFTTLTAFSQTESTPLACPSDHLHEQKMENDPTYAKKTKDFERFYREKVKKLQLNPTAPNENRMTYTIPVVVHIVHDGANIGTEENPMDDAVAAIIQSASDNFQHIGGGNYANPFYGVNTDISLCLATHDPNGNYTTGVTRHYNPNNTVGHHTDLAPALNAYAWDKSKYCNLYIIKNLTSYDGVYVGSYDFTIYNSGNFSPGLITHELGHYFNLRHTFQSGCSNNNCLIDGDRVCDTPPKASSGYTGNANGNNCNQGGDSCTTDDDDNSGNNPYRTSQMGNQLDMMANYMDYTSGCWDSFTEGQKVRMHAAIEANRTTLVNNSIACNPVATPPNQAGIVNIITNQNDVCSSSFTPTFTIHNYGTAPLNNAEIVIKINNSIYSIENWTGNIAAGNEVMASLSSPISISVGNHTISISTQKPNNTIDLNSYDDTDYAIVDYIGGTLCNTVSSCADMNPNSNNGTGNTTTINVYNEFPMPTGESDQIQICVSTAGDVSSDSEVFTIYDESLVNRGTTASFDDCEGAGPMVCFNATINEYSNWVSDGVLSIICDPIGTSINPSLCNNNEICVQVHIPESNCIPDLFIGGTINSATYQANNMILSNGAIQSTENVIFRAGNSIELNPGFEMEIGAILDVDIEACN